MIRSLRKAVRLTQRRPGGDGTSQGKVDLSHPARSPLGTAVVNCAAYRGGVRHDGHRSPEEALNYIRRRPGRGFVWIGLHEPTEEEFAGMAELFGLHPLAVEDAVHAHQRPKLDRYDETLFMVLKTVRYVEHAALTATSEVVETGEIMIFTGKDFVVTVRHGGHGSLGPLREHLEADPGHLAKGPSAVLHAIADHVVDHYLDVSEAVRDDIDEVELSVFAGIPGRGADPGQIYQLKRELMELKRAVTPLARPLQQLSDNGLPLIDPDIRRYFRDVEDHLSRVSDQISGFDALIDSILQANLAQVTVAQNEDMRKITSWAAIIAVPTMVCGVYGMNFEHMPELGWTFGYPLVWGVILSSCFLLYRGFRRNGWL
ncbi:magnesium and cobalt transport protein CorA [Streptomyces sp. NBC_01803]|uniref:magnesium and cobalt transport protein CorA n=1 Tax=Streptomyces sp. NBC_01803 TaxID=2975946 RepID=UPI002DDBCBF9|nr:magnesium and cobalt transport protein CorA [Streptomyces sp. NBC_01803]WSA45750.1 magnesium and cobalt transport protein CorA [Streptomyces sp. NBC_01803]